MPTIEIAGWRPGFNKVGHTKALQEYCHFSLSETKQMTDRVLACELVEINVDSSSNAESLKDNLEKLGANVQIIESK